jgi:hypothetical protein
MVEFSSKMIPSEAVEYALNIFGDSAKQKLLTYLRTRHGVCVSALVPADELQMGLRAVIGSGADLVMDKIQVTN